MSKLKRGFVQVYTGNGKGKTTAAIGLGIRAAGWNLKVYMVQFLKTSESGELETIKNLKNNFEIFRFEKEKGFFWTLTEEEKKEEKLEIQKAYEFCIDALKNKKCDLLILDEILGAFKNELISKEQIIKLIETKESDVEVVLTGRDAPKWLIEKADLVTEMKPIKHYFEKSIPARKGIEY